eukprot:COSAG02_NODE_5803_length_4024_cov_60.505700_4_plen_62_part_00
MKSAEGIPLGLFGLTSDFFTAAIPISPPCWSGVSRDAPRWNGSDITAQPVDLNDIGVRKSD